MKIKTLLLTTTLFVSAAAFAGADATPKKINNSTFKDFYAKVEGGMSAPRDQKSYYHTKSNYKKGLVGGIGGGYKWNEFFRTDLMLQYRKPTTKTFEGKKKNVLHKVQVKIKSLAVMLNGYADYHNDTIFTPYAMLGAGIGRNKATITDNNKTIKSKANTNLIWNAGLGCQAKLTDHISTDLGYRYVNLGKAGKKKKLGKDVTAHEVVLGLIYNF
ncbi:MAG: porin family protein [Rickettsiales bacterium]|nr:porin family protein [Rickettsiales bacterium]